MPRVKRWHSSSVYEGMRHSFFSDPELPESRAAYEVMVRFFDRHLGR
jgi:epsilon-lactone hydrolase